MWDLFPGQKSNLRLLHWTTILNYWTTREVPLWDVFDDYGIGLRAEGSLRTGAVVQRILSFCSGTWECKPLGIWRETDKEGEERGLFFQTCFCLSASLPTEWLSTHTHTHNNCIIHSFISHLLDPHNLLKNIKWNVQQQSQIQELYLLCTGLPRWR